jgi:hydroxylamine reductase
MEEMFCYQCEQAAGGTGCTKIGVCGKTPEVAAIQDLIVWGLKGMAFWADQARQKGAIDRNIDVFMIEALFSTVTNVDFDPENLTKVAGQVSAMRDKAQQLFEKAAGGASPAEIPAAARPWSPPTTVAQAVAEGASIRSRTPPSTPTSIRCSRFSSTAARGWRPTPTMPTSSAVTTTGSTASSTRRWPPPSTRARG